MKRSLLLLAALVLSCSQPDARKELLASTSQRLQDSLADAPASLRYNPVDCDCPPFEVRIGERWVRVLPTANEDPESAIAELLVRARADWQDGNIETYEIPLELDSSSARFCGNGTPYFEVELLEE